MVLLGNRKKNHLGQLMEENTNHITKLLSFIFLSAHLSLLGRLEMASQAKGGFGHMDPGVRMKMTCFIFSYLSRAREQILHLCCLKIMEFSPDRQFYTWLSSKGVG